ncbi:MAG: aryl-sulfate sulfotransferase, partial [Saprospiraceae bacterium]
GYTLFSPFKSTNTFLIDNCGQVVNKWESDYFPAAETVLLENGNLLKTASNGVPSNPVFAFGGGGELIQELDWQGNIVWEFEYSDSTHRMHHDFSILPNGNLLIPAWELKTNAEAIQAGRDTLLLPDGVLWAEYVIELKRESGEIVWEWHMWDHLIQDFDSTKDNYGIVADHPELLNINRTGGPTVAGGKNWMHINSIDYNQMMDQILVNSFFLSEFYIIDHSTSTSQASTHNGGNSNMGGDILYRWGNPANYDHGNADDRTIYGAHNVHWIPQGLEDEGKVMLFNNGNGRPGGAGSSIDVLAPLVDDYTSGQYIYDVGVPFFPHSSEWSYPETPSTAFYSNFLSGAQRLQNGNTLICSGAKGHFIEVNKNKEIVWEYINPDIGITVLTQGDTIPVVGGRNTNIVFRATKYGENYPGLIGKDLTPESPIEVYINEPYVCTLLATLDPVKSVNVTISPNPASENVFIEIESNNIDGYVLEIVNSSGILIDRRNISQSIDLELANYPDGLYIIRINGLYAGRFLKTY